jgi:hypothetical protein
MTLILAQASRRFALEVSKRLVSRGGKAFDAAANKNVIFIAKDAVVAFGYTGRAYSEGVPTDQWIAEVLIGVRFERGRKPPAVRKGGSAGGAEYRPTHHGQSLVKKSCWSADRRLDRTGL